MNDNTKRVALGDRHHGKQVTLVSDGKNKTLFKPRQASAEKALEAFLSHLEQEGFPFVPACEQVLSETEDGFIAAFVPHNPAESEADIHLFFQRCGALIFLAYLFGSNDLHYENIIACKDTPVLVDCETLMTGIAENGQSSMQSLASSVLKSHLLPNWSMIDGKPMLVSGLASNVPGAQCNLLFNGEVCRIEDYEAEVLEGFQAAYAFTRQHHEAVQTALEGFDGCRFRFLLRPTEVYGRLIQLAKKLEEEKKEPYITALLSAGYRRDQRENRLEAMQAVLNEEIKSVLQSDVPYFTVLYNDKGLYGEQLLKRDFLQTSPQEAVKQRMAALSEEDCGAQSRIIEQALAAVRPIEKKTPCIQTGDDLYEAMFTLLENGYIPAISSGFMQLSAAEDGNLYLQSAGFGLYEGLAGILCAYAALYRKTGKREILDALTAHYQPLGDFIHHSGNIAGTTNALSLQEGIVGVTAALLHIFELTGEQRFYDAATTLFGKLQPPAAPIAQMDWLGGISGISTVLLKLNRSLTAPWATLIAEALQDYQPSLSGVAHGAAGVSLALAAAEHCLNTECYDKQILQLLSFEETYFHADVNNWQDLRAEDRVAFMHGWCSGVGGIAMARKSLLALTDNAAIRAQCERDIERAAANLSSDFTAKRDSLCCGNAARLMACSDLNIKNSRLFRTLCDKMKDDSLVLFHVNDTGDRNYGLMQGLAGVIYAIALYGDEKSGGMLLC